MKQFLQEIELYKAVFQDKRLSKTGKFFLSLAIGYAQTPIDFIPDVIPLIGHLDDKVIVPMFIWIAKRFVPAALIQEYRSSNDEFRMENKK